MFRFHLKRARNDFIGHIILILFPVVLISIFHAIYSNQFIEFGASHIYPDFIAFLTIGFALLFQIYGSALSFEYVGNDLFTPMHDRLTSCPIDLRRIVLSVLSSAIIVSFVQTLVVLVFSVLVFKANIPLLYVVLPLMALSVIFNQLLGLVALLFFKKIKTASTVTTFYGIVSPMIVGLYFPLPETPLFVFLGKYITPLGLIQTAIYGAVKKNYADVFIGTFIIVALIVFLFIAIKPLLRRVVS